MKKGFFLFLLLLLVSFGNNVFALDVVRPTEDFYVNDYAEILSEETEKYIMEHSINLYDKAGAQIVVVTVNNLGGASIEDYSLEVARSFGIGDSKKDNGILLIVSKEDRKIRIEVGYGLEGLINDAKAGRLLDDYAIPYLKDNDWNNGIINGYKATYKELNDYYELGEEIDMPVKEEEIDDGLLSIISTLLIGKIIYTIGLFGVDLDSKTKKLIHFIILEVLSGLITLGSFYLGGGEGAFMLLGVGTILNILAVIIYVESSGYYGGGGYSGGHYHGGGSGGHHGGGGHFGGGGASRGF